MDWTKLIDWLKLSSAYFFAAAVAAAFLLFAPSSVLAPVGLATFVTSYRMWIGLALLVSGAVVVARVVEWAARKVTTAMAARRALSNGKSRLNELTPEEATLLAAYVNNDTRTHHLQPTDGVVLGLVDEHVLYRASDVGYENVGFAYNIQPWAFRHLKAHPELLAHAESEYVGRGGRRSIVRTHI